MSNSIVLPPLNINAVAPAFSFPPLGAAPPMPSPAAALAAQHPRRLTMIADGYWREVFIKHMEEVNRQVKNGWKYMPTAELAMDVWKIPVADKYMCLNPHALSREAINAAIGAWGHGMKISDARELSGGVLTPFAAWSHYLDGSGADVVTRLERLGLNPSVTKIPALEVALASATVGSSPVHLPKIPYDTMQDSWITGVWLGHISLRIEGVVHKNHDGSLSFHGVARAYHDTFDFNASTHRSELGEAATAGGNYLGGARGKPYQIIIRGELPISIQR